MCNFEIKREVAGFEEKQKKHFSQKICEGKDISLCSGKIISAHSISRKFLKKIADDGNVCHVEHNIIRLLNNLEPTTVSKIGISKASTYHMFCSTHDKSLFSPIEDRELVPDEEQCFRIMFRTIMMEKYLKECSDRSLDEFIKEGRRNSIDIEYSAGVKSALKDLNAIAEGVKKELLSEDFSKFSTLRVYLRKKPNILCSGAFHPEYDLYGTRLSSLASSEPLRDILAINVLPISQNINQNNGVAILSWRNIDPQRDSKKLIDSLLEVPKDEILNVLIHLIFEYIQNVYFSPKWWESRDAGVKNRVYELSGIEIHNPVKWQEMTTSFDSWNVSAADIWNGEEWRQITLN